MLYPPELQMRIADLPNHLEDVGWKRDLDRDCLAALREHKRVYGRLQHDAYPDAFSAKPHRTSDSQDGPSSRLSTHETVLSKIGETLQGLIRQLRRGA
jgi:hypothetical protein